MFISYTDPFGLMYILLCKIKNKNPGWTSVEEQTLEYLLNVPETLIQVSGPHPSAHVVQGGNYFYTFKKCIIRMITYKYLGSLECLKFNKKKNLQGFYC